MQRVLLAWVAMGMGAAWAQEPVTRSLPASAPALSVEAGGGSILLRAVPGASGSRVTVTPRARGWSEEDCAVVFGGDAARAEVQVRHGEAPARGVRCAVDVVIELAGPTVVDLSLRRGRVDLEGSTAPVAVSLGVGQVRGNPDEEIAITARLARVSLWSLGAPATVDLAAGRLRLDHDRAVAGTVQAAVGLGSVRLAFPYGVLVEDASTAAVGWTRSAIPSRAGEATRVQAQATVGTVRIHTDLEALAAPLTVAQH